MALVPEGWFRMGSTKAEVEAAFAIAKQDYPNVARSRFEAEMPQHQVWLEALYMDMTPVTNREYGQFIDAGGYQQPAYWSAEGWQFIQREKCAEPRYWTDANFNALDHPVVGVSWYEADAYARWAGKLLPTEAQWEKAARGTDGRLYPWGNEPVDGRRARCKGGDERYPYTAPVGAYELGKSPYGIYDLAGNVWEWVQDGYEATYYQRSPERNPVNEQATAERVLRGGGWFYPPVFARVADRYWYAPDTRDYDLGFRCVVGVAGPRK